MKAQQNSLGLSTSTDQRQRPIKRQMETSQIYKLVMWNVRIFFRPGAFDEQQSALNRITM